MTDTLARFKVRGDTLANWTNENPVIVDKQLIVVIDTDPPRLKVGNGTSKFNDLPYLAGITIKTAMMNEFGHLILTLSDNSTIDCGLVKGDPGAAGAEWFSASGVPSNAIGNNGDFYLDRTTADIYQKVAGLWGTPILNIKGIGEKGSPGVAGISVYSATINSSGHLILTLSDNSTIDCGVAKGADGTGTGDMLAATYNPIIQSITGKASGTVIADVSLSTLWNLLWSKDYLLYQPTDGATSDYIPFVRKATLNAIAFFVKGTPTAAVTLTISKVSAGTTTTVGTISLSASGLTVFTPSSSVTIAARDYFYISVSGSGLSPCSISCQLEAVNKL